VSAGGHLLATRSLGLDIGGATIVADVSLEVTEGELLGIIGPNGAGKTSLFNLLSGLYRPTAGRSSSRAARSHGSARTGARASVSGGRSRSRTSFRC
jgi:branched-chain amino acid transport system ATP-binding protein